MELDSENSSTKIDNKSPYVSRYGRSITPKKIHDPSEVTCEDSETKSTIKKRKNKTREASPDLNSSSFENEDYDFENSIRKNKSSLSANNHVTLPKTPYALRQRLRTKLKFEVEKDEEDAFDLSEESEWEESDSESSYSSSDESVVLPSSELPDSKLVLRQNKKSHYVCSPTDYLEKTSAKSLTSTKKFSRLENSELLSQELSSFVPSHSSHISLLCKHNQSLFYKWLYTLSKGYNLIIYGLGTKKALLDQFRNVCLNSCRVLVINGYFPGLTIKEIISSLFDLVGVKSKETIDSLYSLLDQPKTARIFVLVHNIDGLALRQDKTQSFLSQLATRDKVHMVASVDHINAPLLWDQKKLSCFNFIWEDCTTFLPYSKEKNAENSLIARTSASVALSSLRNVFRSLNKNSRSIFELLLDHSLNPKNKSPGMHFSELYRLCRQNFIVSSDLALRTQLTEFMDHQLVKWRKETDVLTISVDNSVLKIFKSEIDSEKQ